MLAIATETVSATADLLSGYSFEISARDAERLDTIRAHIPDGTVVSITYLPGESDAARIAAARAVRQLGLTPMPHVAARRIESRAAFASFLAGVSEQAEVDRLFVIAGDLATPVGPYDDALAVIDDLRGTPHGLKAVGIAGYPEGHPGIGSADLDRALRDKLASLAEQGLRAEIMTQFAFDAEPMVRWLDGLRGAGFNGRVRLGVPGPASVATLLKFAARCGVGASAKVMAKYGVSLTRLLNTAGPDQLYDDLAAAIDADRHGPVAIHLYPFGGLQKMTQWAHLRATR